MKALKNRFIGALLAGLIAMSSGCAFVHIQRPLDTDFDNTKLGAKEGRANNHSILWLVAWGDSGTKAAATDGDIKVIYHADVEVLLIMMGLYTRVTTIVYGD